MVPLLRTLSMALKVMGVKVSELVAMSEQAALICDSHATPANTRTFFSARLESCNSRCAGVGALAVIAFWRFILGFGIGGDYPLSATITSEYANSKWRGAFIASVFAGQVSAVDNP